MKTEFLLNIPPLVKKIRLFESEKDTYPYLNKYVFKDYLKIFSLVAKGLPDYIVFSTYIEELPAGFYEVKFRKAELTKAQLHVLPKLARLSNAYLLRVYEEGSIEVFKILPEE